MVRVEHICQDQEAHWAFEPLSQGSPGTCSGHTGISSPPMLLHSSAGDLGK